MFNKVVNEFITISSNKSDSGEIHIEGDIVDSKWWDDEVSPKDVSGALKELGGVNTLDVYLNSYGGSCVAGNTIVNIIDDYKRKNNSTVNVFIRGIAASMGSGIAMAGDNVSMASNALFMVHKPLSYAYGNADDFEKTIDVLNKTESTLIKNYMRKFNGTEDELRQMMKDETWMTAEEAKEHGFVDEITDEVEIAASAKGIKINNKVFDEKLVDLINKKYPEKQVKKEEEKVLQYDEKLKDFGINEELFNKFEVESEKLLNIADAVKAAVAVEPEKPFVAKDEICQALDCEDITVEELIDFAKAGKNPPDNKPDTVLVNKADAYDKIVEGARDEASKNAVRALGELYNEARVKKMLSVLDYNEIKEQSDAWEKQAENVLHAGERISLVGNSDKTKGNATKNEDYKF